MVRAGCRRLMQLDAEEFGPVPEQRAAGTEALLAIFALTRRSDARRSHIR